MAGRMGCHVPHSTSSALLLLVLVTFTAAPSFLSSHGASALVVESGLATVGQSLASGACGYGAKDSPFGAYIAGVSPRIFSNATACGACYNVRCVNSTACRPGRPRASVNVTVTNICTAAANATTSPCYSKRKAFNLSPAAFSLLVRPNLSASQGVIPVVFSRVPCHVPRATGAPVGIQFKIVQGNPYYIAVLIQNVAGPGDLQAVEVALNKSPWRAMYRNWGSVWSLAGELVAGRTLSFRLTPRGQQIGWVVALGVVPRTWKVGDTYTAPVNFKEASF